MAFSKTSLELDFTFASCSTCKKACTHFFAFSICSCGTLTKKEFVSLQYSIVPFNCSVDPSLSEEINFMRQMEGIKEQITQVFGEMDDSYLDLIVEEFYNETFEVKQ